MTVHELGVLTEAQGRKSRGAFFTPAPIADFLARWAIDGRPGARVLDPTCGDGVFLRSAGEELLLAGCTPQNLEGQVFGVDIHEPSLEDAASMLDVEGLSAALVSEDFFALDPQGSLTPRWPAMDAVIGNPPFVRYQHHTGAARKLSVQAALQQGVRLSGLASSWAALVVHAGGFLAPDGRLAMVLPAELLTVGYAEPVRCWLRQRFAAVKLVLFEHLQFADATENVVLLLAHGTGGCDAFSLYHVEGADDLERIQPFDEIAVAPAHDGKWTDLLLGTPQRQLFKRVVEQSFCSLGDFGAPQLGTVTGANHFFTLSESVRKHYQLEEGVEVRRISPPGTRHLLGPTFSARDWAELRDQDEPVWALWPTVDPSESAGLRRYLRYGESLGVPAAYKCQVRQEWWKPPVVSPPDLFFTYMSHRYPRLVANTAKASFVNSMHGVRLRPGVPKMVRDALPLLALNSVTMLGAEIFGRSYGGGVLKMEPREAATLPVPKLEVLQRCWEVLKPERDTLGRQLRNGLWTHVVARVDDVLLHQGIGLSAEDASMLHGAARDLRARRMARKTPADVTT